MARCHFSQQSDTTRRRRKRGEPIFSPSHHPNYYYCSIPFRQRRQFLFVVAAHHWTPSPKKAYEDEAMEDTILPWRCRHFRGAHHFEFAKEIYFQSTTTRWNSATNAASQKGYKQFVWICFRCSTMDHAKGTGGAKYFQINKILCLC